VPTIHDLAHIARICHLVEGLPLAILLAAAQMDLLHPAEIATRVEGGLDFLAADWRAMPRRHRSMQAAFDVSYRLLSEAEGAAFARLSVFRDGFTAQAAQAVAGADMRALRGLMHKSLAWQDAAGRYQMHELLRQYAVQKLESMPGEKTRTLDRHCSYYASQVAANEAALAALREETVRVELDNVRAAWEHAVDVFDVAHMSQMLNGLDWLLFDRTLVHEALGCFGRAVDALRVRGAGDLSANEQSLLAGLLLSLGSAELFTGQVDETDAHMREAEQIFGELGDAGMQSDVLRLRVMYGLMGGDAEMRKTLCSALALATEAGDETRVGLTLYALAAYAFRLGAYAEARAHCERILQIGERIDDRRLAAWGHGVLGHIARKAGAFAQAREHYQIGLALHGATRNFTHSGIEEQRAHLALAQGNLALARERYERILSVHRERDTPWVYSMTGLYWGAGPCLVRLGDVALRQEDESEARACYAEATQIGLEYEHPELTLDALTGWASFFAQQDGSSLPRAVELAALAAAHPRGALEVRERAEGLLQSLRKRLPPDAFEAARTQGLGRDLEATAGELVAALGKPMP
jgi:tetratricopeptide (TPR) repeat protein